MPVPFFGGPLAGLWDIAQIGPAKFLTKIDFDGEVGWKLDVKSGPEIDGARETNQGYEPAKITVTITLANEQQQRDFEALLTTIRPLPGKTKSTPIDIIHPLLQMYSLRRFWVPKLPLLKKSGPQMFDARFGCVEYFDTPKPKGTKEAPKLVSLATIFDGNNQAAPTKPSKDNTGP